MLRFLCRLGLHDWNVVVDGRHVYSYCRRGDRWIEHA